MVGPKPTQSYFFKKLGEASAAAGKQAPLVVSCFMVTLTNKPDEARAKIAEAGAF